MTGFARSLRHWPARRWWFALGTAAATYLLIAVPTDLIDNPVFGRDVPPTWWSQPVLIATAILSGLLAATYVASPEGRPRDREGKLGAAGAFAAYFAVGCPVCNKLALLALGYSGALRWFGPVQPYLGLIAVGLLAWALIVRVRREDSCTMPGKPLGPSSEVRSVNFVEVD